MAQNSSVTSRLASVLRVITATSVEIENRYRNCSVIRGMAQNATGSQTPIFTPIRNHASATLIVTCRATKSTAPISFMVIRCTREIGFDRDRSMAPDARKSGMMLAVEMSARTMATHESHQRTYTPLKIQATRSRDSSVPARYSSLSFV